MLSFNEIQKIDGVTGLTCLERLDLGYNNIQIIEGIKAIAQPYGHSLTTLEQKWVS